MGATWQIQLNNLQWMDCVGTRFVRAMHLWCSFSSKYLTTCYYYHRYFVKRNICDNNNLSLSSVFCCRAGSGYPNGYPVLGNSRGAFLALRDHILWSEFSFSLALFVRGTLPMLPSCPLSRAFPYPQPGDAGGHRSAPAICQSLTSADPIDNNNNKWSNNFDEKLHHKASTYIVHHGLCGSLRWQNNDFHCDPNVSTNDQMTSVPQANFYIIDSPKTVNRWTIIVQ